MGLVYSKGQHCDGGVTHRGGFRERGDTVLPSVWWTVGFGFLGTLGGVNPFRVREPQWLVTQSIKR